MYLHKDIQNLFEPKTTSMTKFSLPRSLSLPVSLCLSVCLSLSLSLFLAYSQSVSLFLCSGILILQSKSIKQLTCHSTHHSTQLSQKDFSATAVISPCPCASPTASDNNHDTKASRCALCHFPRKPKYVTAWQFSLSKHNKYK